MGYAVVGALSVSVRGVNSEGFLVLMKHRMLWAHNRVESSKTDEMRPLDVQCSKRRGRGERERMCVCVYVKLVG